MYLNMSSMKSRPFCHSLNVLKGQVLTFEPISFRIFLLSKQTKNIYMYLHFL